jgi:hypothetical protein
LPIARRSHQRREGGRAPLTNGSSRGRRIAARSLADAILHQLTPLSFELEYIVPPTPDVRNRPALLGTDFVVFR